MAIRDYTADSFNRKYFLSVSKSTKKDNFFPSNPSNVFSVSEVPKKYISAEMKCLLLIHKPPRKERSGRGGPARWTPGTRCPPHTGWTAGS